MLPHSSLPCPFSQATLFFQEIPERKEGDGRMRASRTPLELGIAFARLYLEQEFGYGNVECIDRPDEEDTQRDTRSFWIDNQGRQRIYFSTEVLEDKRDPRRVLQNLNGSELADYIRQVGCVPVMMTTEGPQTIDEEETSPKGRWWFRRLIRGKQRQRR
jgi:hypothetical protein